MSVSPSVYVVYWNPLENKWAVKILFVCLFISLISKEICMEVGVEEMREKDVK